MLRPLIQRPRRQAVNRPRERGVTMALVAVAIFSIVAMAGLSIDVGTLYEASAEAQRAADSAALTGARMISMSGLTGDPTNGATSGTVSWAETCGGASSPATMAAIVVAQQNTVGGATLPAASITVTYSASVSAVPGNADCSTLGPAFGVNPVVTVQVTQPSLPTYFSRIWGRTGSSVSATASAEVFNPSNSGTYASGGNMVPVQPRCVKPWIVPNYDPLHASGCTTGCTPFVDPATGSINTPGILSDGLGVIGERFWLAPDCGPGTSCPLLEQPQANSALNPRSPSLDYVPGQTSFASIAIPSGSPACSAAAGNYAEAIAGCDQSTQYQCGKAGQNVVDLSENPAYPTGSGDTMNGVQCLIRQGTPGGSSGPTGQDWLNPLNATPNYPPQIQIGSGNPLLGVVGVGPNDVLTSSSSIVSLPIYDTSAGSPTIGPTTTAVTIVGFLQVFINFVDANGNVNVAVMNVSGCGNAATAAALNGTSPVPVRLITPP
jgi:hypothetical protein